MRTNWFKYALSTARALLVCCAISSAVALPDLQTVTAVFLRWSGMESSVMTSRGVSVMSCCVSFFSCFCSSMIISIFSFSRSKLSFIFSRMFTGFLPKTSSCLFTSLPLLLMCTKPLCLLSLAKLG